MAHKSYNIIIYRYNNCIWGDNKLFGVNKLFHKAR